MSCWCHEKRSLKMADKAPEKPKTEEPEVEPKTRNGHLPPHMRPDRSRGVEPDKKGVARPGVQL